MKNKKRTENESKNGIDERKNNLFDSIMLRLSNIDIELKNGLCCFMHLLY